MTKSVAVICEGRTEMVFVEDLLSKHIHSLDFQPIEIGDHLGGPQAGGDVSYTRFVRDFRHAYKNNDHVTTLFDFYGLGRGWPTINDADHDTNVQKVEALEQLVFDSVMERFPRANDGCFIPFFALHEFEALLFSDTQKMHEVFRKPKEDFDAVLEECGAPEDINSRPETAPSKRIESVYRAYKKKKALKGTTLARAITIEKMRQKCPHFNSWLEKIEALVD